jgi:hypothetical protein
MEENKKEYLGDGVYVQYDGNMGVTLTTWNGYETTNEIYLEDTVFYELKRYWERMYEGKEPDHEYMDN